MADAAPTPLDSRRERVVSKLPGPLAEIPKGLFFPILVSVGIVFAVNAAVYVASTRSFHPWEMTVALTLHFAGSIVALALAFIVGHYLGATVWPRHGRSLARRIMRRYALKPERGQLVMTGRPEFSVTRSKRIFECTSLVAGTLMLATTIGRSYLPFEPTLAVSVGALFVTAYLTVVFVPHWEFGRLGLRRVDHGRFIVQPLTRDFLDRWQISNGAVLLIVSGVVGFILRQSGQTDTQSTIDMVQIGISVFPISIILVATAVAFFQREETAVVEALARDAVALGYVDARGEDEMAILEAMRRPAVVADSPARETE